MTTPFTDHNFVSKSRSINGYPETHWSLYSGYGETSGGGIRAGKQDLLFTRGNTYLKENYPLLDYIVKATVEK